VEVFLSAASLVKGVRIVQMQGIQMQGIANPSARSAPPMLPKRTPDKRKKKSESPARSPASIEESTAGFERQSSSSRSSVRGLGRGMSFRPLAQMRFKTLNDLFPSRMRPHDGEEEEDAPVVIEDEVEAKPYTRYVLARLYFTFLSRSLSQAH